MSNASRIEALREKQSDFDAELTALSARSALTAAQENHFNQTLRARDKITHALEELEARASRLEEIRNRPDTRMLPGVPDSIGSYSDRTVQAEALVALERVSAQTDMPARAADAQDAMIRKDPKYAAEFEVHSRSEYLSGFGKLMTVGDAGQAALMMTDLERQAFADSYNARAQAEGATTQGGFAVPVFIDPSVILTNQESDNPFLRIANVVDITTNAWKGVSAAGISWSFDAEAAAVSDDSITLAQPSATVFMARGFVPFSIEVGQDWPGFQSEMARLLGAGYDELCLSKFTSGSGTGEPKGILTALTAQTSTETVVTTDGLFGQEDIYKVWKALPQKYRRRASWMMSADVMNRVRQFGTANVYHATTITLVEGAVENLFSRPVYDNAYFPDFTGTTGSANICCVGDFGNYVVARRSGMTVELVPHLLDPTTGTPTGQRGFFAYARIGANASNPAGFQVLVNT